MSATPSDSPQPKEQESNQETGLAPCPLEFVELLKMNAYNLWGSTLCVGPPKLQQLFDELHKPNVGDLVMETTTFRMKSRDPREGIGRLVKIAREPFYTRESAKESGYEEGEEIPEETVYYIKLCFDDNREYRWSNANFIKVKEDAA